MDILYDTLIRTRVYEMMKINERGREMRRVEFLKF